jgi:hypothetical protein
VSDFARAGAEPAGARPDDRGAACFLAGLAGLVETRLPEAAVFFTTAAAFFGAGLAFLTVLTAFVVLTALTAVGPAVDPFLAVFFPDGTEAFLADAARVSDDFCVLGMVYLSHALRRARTLARAPAEQFY